nr:hypothetical protein [uncultured Dyadobacter sp.]
MKRLRQFLCSVALTLPILLVSCEKGSSLIESSEKGNSELVLQTESGKVTFDGTEMNFENFKTLSEYQSKINEDQNFKIQIHEKYAEKLAIGQLNSESFTKKYLFDKLTNDYLHVVNNKGMFVISGHLVRFDQEYQYEVPIKDRKLLSVINEKDIDLDLVRRDVYGVTHLNSGPSNGRTQISLPGNGSNFYQSSFVIQSPDAGANQTRRYIHELFGHRGATVGSQTQHRLILRFKMLNSGNGNAGEPRTLSYSVYLSGTFNKGATVFAQFGNENFSNSQTTTNPEERVLSELYTTDYTNFGTWNVTVSGYMTSKLISTNGYDYAYTTGTGLCCPYPVLW